MTDEGTAQEPRSLSGDIEPSGAGAWVSRKEQATREGIDDKALYRRVQRGKMLGRRNPDTGEPEVWVPVVEEPASTEQAPTVEEPRSLAVPEAERFAALLEDAITRAVAPLNDTIVSQQERIEALIRENERLQKTEEQRSWREELRSLWRRLTSYN